MCERELVLVRASRGDGEVGDYLRGNKLSHTVWDTYEAIVEACANAWRFLIDDPDRIRSIAYRDWAWVNL